MFNFDAFNSEANPWLLNVFKQPFDVYIPIAYPHNHLVEEGYLRPFSFLNNIDQQEIIIKNLEGKVLRHTFDYTKEDTFLGRFVALNFNKERFLFWTSENESWAMVSDNQNAVAIYAMPFNTASQVTMFYENSILPPRDFLQKINAPDATEAYLKNYSPSTQMSIGSEANPAWTKFIIKCHVSSEHDKLFYWKNFEKLHHTFAKLLSDFKSVYMWPNQHFNRWYWQNKQWYSSNSNAPTGGWQKFSYENCHKVANKFLTQNTHLVANFEGEENTVKEFYSNAPKGLIEFMNFWIYGDKNNKLQAYSFKDFFFRMGMYDFGKKTDEINQKFEFSFRTACLDESKVAAAIKELEAFCGIVQIIKIEKPYTMVVFELDKKLHIESIYSFRGE